MSGNMGILGKWFEKINERLSMFLAHHVPILGVLKPGVVSVFESDGNTKRYFGKWIWYVLMLIKVFI
jgi:hypothetical protein